MKRKLCLLLSVVMLVMTFAPNVFAAPQPQGEEVKIGSYIKFGHYEQDNDLTNGKEEIEWLVLGKDSENNRYLVISKYGLDAKAFGSVSWKQSDLRSWLNDSFVNTAFDESERWHIKLTATSSDTLDYVFVMSSGEIYTYYPNKEDRACCPTKYAIANGAYTYAKENYFGNCYWWLRTPGDSGKIRNINVDGAEKSNGIAASLQTCMVRPSMWISLNSNNHSSDYCIGDTLTLGYYEQDNITDNGPEPIEWIIESTDETNGIVVLVSKYILEQKQFHENEWELDITWHNSSIRKWLNNQFLNSAFSKYEKYRIAEANKSDMVYLPDNSMTKTDHTTDYWGDFGYYTTRINELIHITSATPYAKSKGNTGSYWTGISGIYEDPYGWDADYEYHNKIEKVSPNGVINNYTIDPDRIPVETGYDPHEYAGIRPVIAVKLQNLWEAEFWNSIDKTSKEIIIPSEIRAIPDRAFEGCNDLERIFIPDSVEIVGRDVFANCENLEDVYCAATDLPKEWDYDWNKSSFANIQWGSKVPEKTMEPTQSPIPSQSPTPSPSPTPTLTPIPTPTPSPTPSPEPTLDPARVVFLSITHKPNKISYSLGEEFDPAGIVVRATRANGTYDILEAEDLEFSYVDNSLSGVQNVEILYEGIKKSFAVKFVGRFDVRAIKIRTKPYKLTYKQGEPVDVTGMVVNAYSPTGEVVETLSQADIRVWSFNTFNGAGIFSATVSYMDYYKTTFSYKVTTEKFASSYIVSKPTKMIYKIGESFDSTGMTAFVKYYDKTTEAMDISKFIVSGFDNTKSGIQTIDVSYNGQKVKTFSIRVTA